MRITICERNPENKMFHISNNMELDYYLDPGEVPDQFWEDQLNNWGVDCDFKGLQIMIQEATGRAIEKWLAAQVRNWASPVLEIEDDGEIDFTEFPIMCDGIPLIRSREEYEYIRGL